jgi:DNA polymerase III sliding clamp (beta) subunit (PCNA family)
VLYCIDPSEVRNALKGLNITIDENKIIFVGTNGVKLAESTMNINADIRQAFYIFRHDLAAILHLILDDDSQVFVAFEGRYVYLKCNDLYIVGSLIINETYPDYKSMFECDKAIVFPRIDFIDSVIAVMDVLDPEDNHRLTLNFTDNKLMLKNDRVEATHEFDDNFGASLDVDVNGMFLASMLRDFTGDDLTVHFSEGNNYIVFKSKDNDDYIVLITVVKRR